MFVNEFSLRSRTPGQMYGGPRLMVGGDHVRRPTSSPDDDDMFHVDPTLVDDLLVVFLHQHTNKCCLRGGGHLMWWNPWSLLCTHNMGCDSIRVGIAVKEPWPACTWLKIKWGTSNCKALEEISNNVWHRKFDIEHSTAKVRWTQLQQSILDGPKLCSG
jgi:hypothetical protein